MNPERHFGDTGARFAALMVATGTQLLAPGTGVDVPWAQAYATAWDVAAPLPAVRLPVGEAAGQVLADPIVAAAPLLQLP
ncbi:hypothetical protein GCM10009827_010790 [Dactylosporangium maewongense]|uniref:Uncharacterized protein n=1 Tax=Dactylosporangium maewongense TaxID=634393 RepID=A0ABN1ZNK4_9ACTN